MRDRIMQRVTERRARHVARGRAYRVAVAVAGFAVLVAGLAMLVLPGPGLLTIAVGLALLALEFAWAERLLGRTLDRVERVRPKSRRSGGLTILTVAIAAAAAVLLLDLPFVPV
jgi:uncharacterized protein (TIGR02611 family)